MATTSDGAHRCQDECTASAHFDQYAESLGLFDQRSQAELIGLYKHDYSERGWHVTRVVESAGPRTSDGIALGVYFVAKVTETGE